MQRAENSQDNLKKEEKNLEDLYYQISRPLIKLKEGHLGGSIC